MKQERMSKQVRKMHRRKHEQVQGQIIGVPDDLALENAIRKRHNADWPKVVREMLTRVQSVNQAWWFLMNAIMMTEGLRVTFAREGDELKVTVSDGNSNTEQAGFKPETVTAAKDHIEVLLVDHLNRSTFIRNAYNRQ